MHTVVYAYDEFDMTVERRVLGQINADLIPSHGITSPESREVLRKADVLMITLQKVTSEVMDGMPNCKLISRLGVGIDNIDVPAATQRGIWVANVPDYGVDEVSVHAMSLVLAQLRGLPHLIAGTHQGRWDASAVRPIMRFAEQTMGIIGFGRIGRALATKASGFGVRILAYDPYLDSAAIQAGGGQPADLETLLRESDFVSLHLPLDDKTRHIINARTLALMKTSAYLINTARGGLIDEAALLAAVQSNQIRGAALDVLSIEPPPKDHPVLSGLLEDERILITPHIAWYSEQAMIDMRTRAAEDVLHILRGEKPRTPVNSIVAQENVHG